METFVFGPIQTKWLESLEQNGHRQGRQKLGTRPDGNKPDDYRACCLGELGLIAGLCEWDGINLAVCNINRNTGLLVDVYTKVGLHTQSGGRRDQDGKPIANSLSSMNDGSGDLQKPMTWAEIAKEVREHPQEFFSAPF